MKKIVAVVLLLVVGMALTFAVGVGFYNSYDTYINASLRLSDVSPWVFNLGFGYGGLSVSGEYWFLDNPFFTFGDAKQFSFNWHLALGVYVKALGTYYFFGAGAYPMIGISWWWHINAKNKLELMLQYAPLVGLSIVKDKFLTFDTNGFFNYRVGLRFHF